MYNIILQNNKERLQIVIKYFCNSTNFKNQLAEKTCCIKKKIEQVFVTQNNSDCTLIFMMPIPRIIFGRVPSDICEK